MKDYEQFLLPLLNTSAPPVTREDCGQVERPCRKYSCRMNLAVETERAGKPHEGQHPPPQLRTLEPGEDSCALDVADRGEHSNSDVGKKLGISGARVRQLVVRGGVKLLVRSLLEEVYDEHIRPRLPAGVTLELAELDGYDTDSMSMLTIVDIPKMGPAPSGVTVRRKAT